MKLPELKNKFKNKYAIRIIAGVLVVAMVGTGFTIYGTNSKAAAATSQTAIVAASNVVENEPEAAENQEEKLTDALNSSIKLNEVEIGKEETVYVITDNTGKATKTIVSDHLVNNGDKATIEDVSTLTDIENVKGDETFTQNGKNVTWQAEGNDIFYQGTTTAKTPISESITYYLDGKEIKPEDLAGQSGKVTIHFDYTNNEKVKTTIGGKETEVCVPFVALTGMVLDDSFTNVEVTNGKVVTDGDKNLVIGYTLPGLKDSLNVEDSDFDSDVTIPDYFEVTADVEDFSLEMTMTAAVNATNFISAEGENDLSSVDDMIETLTDATTQLQDGSGDLADGLDTLQSKMGDFAAGMNTLAEGINTLKDSSATLADGVTTLNTSAKSISDGIATLNTSLNTALTDSEKASYAAQATATVDAAFAKDGDTYDYIYNQAKTSFSNAMSGSAAAISAGLSANLKDTLYQKVYNEKLQEIENALVQAGELDTVRAGMTANGMDGANASLQEIAEFYYQYANNISLEEAVHAGADSAIQANMDALASGIATQIASQGAGTTAESVIDACRQASEGAARQALVTGIESTKSTISSKINENQSNGYSLVTGSAALSQGTQTLADKMPELLTGIQTLSDGAVKLNDGAAQLTDGVSQLDDGAHTLAEGIVTFNQSGINEIVNAYQGDAEPLIERIQAVLNSGADYQTFTDIADGVNGSVKFIYKTEAVKAEE